MKTLKGGKVVCQPVNEICIEKRSAVFGRRLGVPAALQTDVSGSADPGWIQEKKQAVVLSKPLGTKIEFWGQTAKPQRQRPYPRIPTAAL
jgi:hypothetical protein